MILIADSGATKTDWRLIEGMQIRSMTTLGINPYHSSDKEISEELGLDKEESRRLLLLHGSVRNVLDNFGQKE